MRLFIKGVIAVICLMLSLAFFASSLYFELYQDQAYWLALKELGFALVLLSIALSPGFIFIPLSRLRTGPLVPEFYSRLSNRLLNVGSVCIIVGWGFNLGTRILA